MRRSDDYFAIHIALDVPRISLTWTGASPFGQATANIPPLARNSHELDTRKESAARSHGSLGYVAWRALRKAGLAQGPNTRIAGVSRDPAQPRRLRPRLQPTLGSCHNTHCSPLAQDKRGCLNWAGRWDARSWKARSWRLVRDSAGRLDSKTDAARAPRAHNCILGPSNNGFKIFCQWLPGEPRLDAAPSKSIRWAGWGAGRRRGWKIGPGLIGPSG